MLSHGSHACISYPMPGYVYVDSVAMCNWLKIPSKDLRKYLKCCQDLDMIEDLKVNRGFFSCKVVLPAPYANNQ